MARGDVDAICADLDSCIRWEIAEGSTYEGIDHVRRFIERTAEDRVTALSIRHLLSHGKQVAVEGETSSHRFVHLITFTGHGKTSNIAEVVTYLASLSA